MGKYSLGREFLFKIIALTGCVAVFSGTPVTSAYASTEPPVAPQGTTSTGSASSPTGMTSTGTKSPMCDKSVFEGVSDQVQRIRAAKDDTALKYSQPPTPPSTIANTPCMSQQMASITNKFSNAPSNYTNQIVGGLTGNPVGSLVAGVFRSGYNSGRSAVADWPQAIGLQNKFNIAMTSLFQSLGLEDSPFASDLCGLMLDSMLSFIQCNTSFNLPSLTMPSFNMPSSCASNVARQGLYQAANKRSFDILADQPGQNLPRTIPTPAKTGSGQ